MKEKVYELFFVNEKHEWECVKFNGKDMSFSTEGTLLKAIKENIGKHLQIIYKGHFMICLYSCEHEINWFMDNHNKLRDRLNDIYPSYDNNGKVKKLNKSIDFNKSL